MTYDEGVMFAMLCPYRSANQTLPSVPAVMPKGCGEFGSILRPTSALMVQAVELLLLLVPDSPPPPLVDESPSLLLVPFELELSAQKTASTLHAPEHPSPSPVLPSSHASAPSSRWLPQRPEHVKHLLLSCVVKSWQPVGGD